MSDLIGSLAIYSPKVSVNCPHCKASIPGNKLIPANKMEGPLDFTTDVLPKAGPEQYIERTKQTMEMVLPVHHGITPDRLLASREAAKNGCLAPLYNQCVSLHNSSPYAGKATYVWGAGNPTTASILMIGEAPGPDEDRFAMPFVGLAGQTLSAIMDAAEISRADDVLLVNTVTYMPRGAPGKNFGKPSCVDMLHDRPRIMAIIDTLMSRPKPLKAVVCLGKYAYVQLAQEDRLVNAVEQNTEVNFNSIVLSRLRGWHTNILSKTPVLVEYHPSYIQRQIQGVDSPMSNPEVVSYLESFKRLRAV